MLKLILNIVYALLTVSGGWYLLFRYHAAVGATGMFYVLVMAVLIFVVVGILLITVYVPSAEPLMSSESSVGQTSASGVSVVGA